ncbi:MAG: class I SAM-dependent methyltransferase, partial [Bacteroidia bacterium]|nr:class I SAM-dependent methyltransferase [Bacteroidia bacterium]
MKKLQTLWNVIKTAITEPGRLRLVVDYEKEYLIKIKNKYPNYINGLPVINISEFISGKNDVIEPYTFLGGNSLPTDIALLRSLAKQLANCQYFEIGTWRGESAANLADVAAQCITLNLPDSTMIEKGLFKNYIEMHRYFSKHLKNVIHLQHDSLTFDFSKYKNSMDLIFVDGDHHYREVQSDT